MMSLRSRLLLFLLMPLLPLSAVLIGLIYWAIQSATTDSYDRVLEGSALAIADRVVLEGGSLVVDLPYAALQMLTNSAEDRVFYSVQKYPTGEVITGYRNLPAPDFGEAERIVRQIDFRGEAMRMIGIRDEALSYSQREEFIVLVAETLGQRNNALQRYLRFAIIAFVVGIVLVGLITLYAVNLGLRPLLNLADAVRLRGERDLRAIRRKASRWWTRSTRSLAAWKRPSTHTGALSPTRLTNCARLWRSSRQSWRSRIWNRRTRTSRD